MTYAYMNRSEFILAGFTTEVSLDGSCRLRCLVPLPDGFIDGMSFATPGEMIVWLAGGLSDIQRDQRTAQFELTAAIRKSAA